MTLLSFVIPCYRSELTIRSVTEEIIKTVSERVDYDYEIICVNDCSPDDVLSILREMAAENNKIKVINFARNMGKHAALLAGYHFVSGEYVVTLDDDMQSPTYELWRLIEPLERDESDAANASYPVKKQALWKNLGSRFNNRVSVGVPIIIWLTERQSDWSIWLKKLAAIIIYLAQRQRTTSFQISFKKRGLNSRGWIIQGILFIAS